MKNHKIPYRKTRFYKTFFPRYHLMHTLAVYANEDNDTILNLLNLTVDDIPRFRGAYRTGCYIFMRCRGGGGNREWLQEDWGKVKNNPWYMIDRDCDYDCTYAWIAFKIPNTNTSFSKE